MKMRNIRNDQHGFISVSLGFALLAVFGTITAGIEMAHRDTEHQFARGAEATQFEPAQDVVYSEQQGSQRHDM